MTIVRFFLIRQSYTAKKHTEARHNMHGEQQALLEVCILETPLELVRKDHGQQPSLRIIRHFRIRIRNYEIEQLDRTQKGNW